MHTFINVTKRKQSSSFSIFILHKVLNHDLLNYVDVECFYWFPKILTLVGVPLWPRGNESYYIHEDEGLIPALAQWVQDPSLPPSLPPTGSLAVVWVSDSELLWLHSLSGFRIPRCLPQAPSLWCGSRTPSCCGCGTSQHLQL